MLQAKIVQKKTRFMFSNFFFLRKLWLFYEIMWKNGRARQATDDSDGSRDLHAGWLRKEYRHTLRIFDILCFSTSTMFTPTHVCTLSVLLFLLTGGQTNLWGGSDTSATDVRVLKWYMAVEFGKICDVTVISGNIFCRIWKHNTGDVKLPYGWKTNTN